MKTIIIMLFVSFITIFSYAQNDTLQKSDSTVYKILKTDGDFLIGKILKQDSREILLLTSDNREIYVPQYIIKEITPLEANEFDYKGDFVGEDKFATRYFITTNGLPIKKGEHYVQWNLFGPDFQFGLGRNFGAGIMTSWSGIPVIGTIKKSFILGEKSQFALGALVGSGTWAAPNFGGALPFATLSFGDRRANIAFSGGYGMFWADGSGAGRGLASIAGMVKVSTKLSLVFDSFILTPRVNDNFNQPLIALVIPGVRWHQEEGKAFQFGFTGVVVDGDLFPVPIPMVQWYRTL